MKRFWFLVVAVLLFGGAAFGLPSQGAVRVDSDVAENEMVVRGATTRQLSGAGVSVTNGVLYVDDLTVGGLPVDGVVGGLYIHDGSYTNALAIADTYYQITGWSTGVANNATLTTSNITVTADGYYTIHHDESFSDGVSKTVDTTIFVNGVHQNKSEAKRKLSAAGDVGSSGAGNVFLLSAGDVVDVRQKCVGSTANIVIEQANFYLTAAKAISLADLSDYTGDIGITGNLTVNNALVNKPYEVYIIAGQSNLGTITNTSALVEIGLDGTQSDVLYSYHVVYGSTYNSALTTLQPVTTNLWGPEISAGRAMADEGRNIMFIKVQEGSTGLADQWIPGQPKYIVLTNQITQAVSALDAAGYEYSFKEFWWIGSENDCNTTDAPNQASNLELLRTGIIDHTGASNLVFKIARVHNRDGFNSDNGFVDIVQEQQYLFLTNGVNREMVSTDDFTLSSFPGGVTEIHYTGQDQINLGLRLAGVQDSPVNFRQTETINTLSVGGLVINGESYTSPAIQRCLMDTNGYVVAEENHIRVPTDTYPSSLLWTSFKESSGDFSDYSLMDGTVTNASVTRTAWDVTNSVSAYIKVEDNKVPTWGDSGGYLALTNTTQVTLSCWLNLRDWSGVFGDRYLFGYDTWGNDGSWLLALYDNGSASLVCTINYWDGTSTALVGIHEVVGYLDDYVGSDEWHMLTISIDMVNGVTTSYFDGSYAATKIHNDVSGFTFTGTPSTLYIGGLTAALGFHNGYMDEVYIYNGLESASDIKERYLRQSDLH